MARSLTEQKVLKKLGIDDFRHLTKDKVITMASMLDRMDPEVATGSQPISRTYSFGINVSL